MESFLKLPHALVQPFFVYPINSLFLGLHGPVFVSLSPYLPGRSFCFCFFLFSVYQGGMAFDFCALLFAFFA